MGLARLFWLSRLARLIRCDWVARLFWLSWLARLVWHGLVFFLDQVD